MTKQASVAQEWMHEAIYVQNMFIHTPITTLGSFRIVYTTHFPAFHLMSAKFVPCIGNEYFNKLDRYSLLLVFLNLTDNLVFPNPNPNFSLLFCCFNSFRIITLHHLQLTEKEGGEGGRKRRREEWGGGGGREMEGGGGDN